MFIGTLRLNRVRQFVFASLTVLFFLLSIDDFTGNAAIKTFAGFEGIICGLSAIYAALAQVWNEIYGKEVAPLGKV
jgi:succinate-acetate transporter protein